MDRKGAKSNGSQFIRVSKENAVERTQSKKRSVLPLQLPSMQGTKDAKSNVHQSKVPTKHSKANKNVSLVSIKSRRSVGFNAASASAKAVEAENGVALVKRKRNLRPALLPRNLISRSGNSYCLVDNRRSYGPEYHPDVPSKKKSASKLGKVFGNNRSVLVQAKENTESSKSYSKLSVTAIADEATRQKQPQTRSQTTSGKTALKSSRNASQSSLSIAAVSTGNGVQSRANERLKTIDNRPQLRVPADRTKTLSRFVSGSLPHVHGMSGSRKSHSDKEIICSYLRKSNESCVRDQEQISPFVSLTDDGFRAGQDPRDKAAEQPLDREKSPQYKDTDQTQTHDKHRSGLSWSDSNHGKLTDAHLTASVQNQCINASRELQITDFRSVENTGKHLNQAGNDICKQVGDSKPSIINISDNSDGFGDSIKTILSEGQAFDECSMSGCVDSSGGDYLPDDTRGFANQASHTLSRKFTWFKDERADLGETEEVCREIEDLSWNVDNNKSNTSFSCTGRGSKLVRQRQRLTGKGFASNGNISHKISTPNAVNSASRPRLGGERSTSEGEPKLSEYNTGGVDTCLTPREQRTAGPGTSKRVTGGNSEDKELSGLKKPLKRHTDSALAVKTRTDSFTVSHSPPGETCSRSHLLQHDLELEAETLSENLNSISSQLSGRVDWTDVDFSPYYYNSETEVDSPPRREVNIERKRVENNYGQAGSRFCPRETIDSYGSHKKRKEIEVGRLYSGNASVRCVGTCKSTYVNHSSNPSTTRRRCSDESVNGNNFSTTESQVQSSVEEQTSERRESASSSSSSSSSSPANYSQCSCGSRPTCTDLGRSGKCAALRTGNGPLEYVRQRLSPGAASGICDTDSDVSSVDVVRLVSHTFRPENGGAFTISDGHWLLQSLFLRTGSLSGFVEAVPPTTEMHR
ncbi:uncharacterized protein LOC135479840 [Liolophura sinensis]|uniref:uncharacterized protein LOC135479840 n=1 Tax=Liolophura sinensis TaxID=3198878 RepID=UPI003158EBBE